MAFKSFCRGSLKRLKKAETKVSHAKRDMEEIIQLAKVKQANLMNALKLINVESE